MPDVAPTARPTPPDFDAFYASQYGPLVRLAWASCGRVALAEELAQDALAEAWRRWDSVAAMERPNLWVRRVLLNRSVSAWRRRRVEANVAPRLATRDRVEPVLPEPDAALWAAVRSLPQRQRQLMVLIAAEDRSLVEAALALGISEDTARTHLRRARARLAATLGEEKDE